MEDIIATVPVYCSDCNTYHVEHYWIYDDGTYSVCDSNGNHDDCDEADVPSPDDICKAWLDYSKYVVATGADPCGEFMVRATRKQKVRWQFRFAPCIGGVALVAARRGRTVVKRADLPAYVRDYLQLDNPATPVLKITPQEAQEAGIPFRKWVTETLTEEVPNPHYVRDLKRAARRHIKREATVA